MGPIDSCEALVEAIDTLGIEATVRKYRKPPLHTRILRDLYDLYHDQATYLEFLVNYPLIPSDLAERISIEADIEHIPIAGGLATNPRSSQQTLNRLCSHTDATVRIQLASNPNLTPKECQQLVQDENTFVRATLALNPSLPSQLQFILADDTQTCVRAALGKRKTLDPDIAVHLSNDPQTTVRSAIINNWTGDPELLHLWANSDNATNQQLLLRRSQALEPAAIDSIRCAPDFETRRNAFQRSELSGPYQLLLAESDNPEDRLFLAEQNDLPSSIQRILAQDSSPKVRRRLASNATLNPSIALHIAASDDLASSRALAKNPALQPECIAELCNHPDDNIALLIAYREDLTDQHYDQLINQRSTTTVAEHLAYQQINYKPTDTTSITQLAAHTAPSIRAYAAQSTTADASTLNKLSQDPTQLVRYQVALNPNTPIETLQKLTHDNDRETIFAAEETLSQHHKNSTTTHQPTTQPKHPKQARTPQSDLLKKVINFFKD